MKVLHVINALSDGGGAEKLMEDLLPAIKQKGVDVSVAVLMDLDSKNTQHIKDAGIEIIPIGSGKRLYSIPKMLKLIKVMRRFDIVHSHLTQPFLMCAFDSLFCKVKIVHTIHNTDSRMRHIFPLKYLEKWALNRYQTIVACSKEAEFFLREFLGKTNKDILTINNGIKLDKFITASPYTLRKNSHEKIITMVAIFRPQKNHEALIRTTKLLPNNYNTYFIGYGPLIEKMENLSKELGVGNRVHFLGKRTDVPQLLKASDFVVLSSHYEGLSLSSIEGMAAGKPFIASDVPGLREIVKGYGLLFEDGNAQQLADIILRLSENEQEYQQVANRCSQRANDFNIETTASEYVNVYNKLMEA